MSPTFSGHRRSSRSTVILNMAGSCATSTQQHLHQRHCTCGGGLTGLSLWMPIRAALRHPTAPTRPPWIFGHLQQHRHEALPAPGRSRFPEHPEAFNTPSWTGQACFVPNRTTGSTLAGGLGFRPHRQLGYPYQHRTPKALASWNDPGVPTQAPARPASTLDHTVHVHAVHPHPHRGRRTRCPDHARQANYSGSAQEG